VRQLRRLAMLPHACTTRLLFTLQVGSGHQSARFSTCLPTRQTPSGMPIWRVGSAMAAECHQWRRVLPRTSCSSRLSGQKAEARAAQ